MMTARTTSALAFAIAGAMMGSHGLPTSAALTTTAITAGRQPPADALQKLAEAVAAVNGLDAADFKNKSMRSTLTTKINVVVDLIRQRRLPEAIDKLQNVLAKLDGCGVQPDASDWIVRCPAQFQVRPFVAEALAALSGI